MDNKNQPAAIGLLYPAMQKFYSALNCLEQFKKGNNFFDNISSLDSFFSEYRNVTFVLQKSLAHTEYEDIYEKNREQHLKNETCKWFIDKRNEVLKQHPFYLEKKVIITVYSPQTSIALPEQIFTIENDVEYSTLIESLKSFLIKINHVEVFFSVEFSFYEKGVGKELYDNLIEGINKMQQFLLAMKDEIQEECNLCNQLQQRIDKLTFYKVPKNMLFIDDYVYYCQENKFEKSSRMEAQSGIPKNTKLPLFGFFDSIKQHFGEQENDFFYFITLHTVIFDMQKTLMPTFMIIYEDDTFELTSFTGSIKTTVYRKINDIAKRIEQDSIKLVFFVTEMLNYKNSQNDYIDILKTNSNERAKHRTSESLCFFMLNRNLQYQSFAFDSDKVGNMEYVGSILKNPVNEYMDINFLQPIKDEFRRLNDKNSNGS